MRKYKKHRLYPKIYPKAKAFAYREYVDGYDLEPLNEGYYHGYVAGVKAMQRALNNLSIGKKNVKELVESVIGKGKLI